MDDLQNSPIFELSKSAERCSIGYETLYRQTKLSFASQNCCSLAFCGDSYGHGSDADDEITDLSGECLDSSSELKYTPKQYLICNSDKPLSFIIRRCEIDTQSLSTSSVSKTSRVLSYGRELFYNKFQVQESSYDSHVESSSPEVINNVLSLDNCNKHARKQLINSFPQETTHLNINEVCVEDVQNEGDAIFEVDSQKNRSLYSTPTLSNCETNIDCYENKCLSSSVDNNKERCTNNVNFVQEFSTVEIYKEKAENGRTVKILGRDDTLVDEDKIDYQVKNDSSLKPQEKTVALDNYETCNFTSSNSQVIEEFVINGKIKSHESTSNSFSIQQEEDRDYRPNGKCAPQISNGLVNNDNLITLEKNKKCIIENNNFKLHCNSHNILPKEVEVRSVLYNEERDSEYDMKDVPFQLLSNKVTSRDSREKVNECVSQNILSKETENSICDKEDESVNKPSVIQNDLFISSDETSSNEPSSPVIHSQYCIQTDLCHSHESLSNVEESQNNLKNNNEISSDKISQTIYMRTEVCRSQEYLLVDNDSTASKGVDMTAVNVENVRDRPIMSPGLTVSAECFASFEEIYDMYNQNNQITSKKLASSINNNVNKDFKYSVNNMSIIEVSGDYKIPDFCKNTNSDGIEKSNLEILENQISVPSVPLNAEMLNPEENGNNDSKIVCVHDSCDKSEEISLETFGIQPRKSPVQAETSVDCISVQDSNLDNQSISAKNMSALKEHFKDSYLNDDVTMQSSISLSPKNPIRTIGIDESENPSEIIINDQYLPVNMETESNIMEEDTTDFVEQHTSSGLLDDLAGSRTSFANTDSTNDQFSKHNEEHSSSFIAQTFTEDAMDCSYSEIPTDKTFLQHSPLLFSSDDENTYYTVTDTINCPEKAESEKPDNYTKILTQEQKKLHRLQEALMGVPPPPSITVPQIDVGEILRLLRENEELMMISTDGQNNNDAQTTGTQKSGCQPSSIEHIKTVCWPESKSYCFYDIQFNHGKVSEDFESLCQKLRERYVGCETTSSCTVWFTQDISNKISNMTNKRRNIGRSPGRRLSHLARRRQTFSSANLLNNGIGQLPGSLRSTISERRHLMIEVKKNDRRHKTKSVRLQKEVPSADTSKLHQTKRALFKSPPNIHKRVSSASKSRSGSKKDRSSVDRHKIQSSKRALWPAESNDDNKSRTGHDRALTNISGHINVYGKRKREDTDVAIQSNKCSRKLFSDSPKRKTDHSKDKNHKSNNGENGLQISTQTRSSHKNASAGLSERHRKKLLWAIAEALRAEGISISHESFRPCASMLGYLVRTLLPDLNCKREGSTSDLMLKLSKKHVKDVIKKYQIAGKKNILKT